MRINWARSAECITAFEFSGWLHCISFTIRHLENKAFSFIAAFHLSPRNKALHKTNLSENPMSASCVSLDCNMVNVQTLGTKRGCLLFCSFSKCIKLTFFFGVKQEWTQFLFLPKSAEIALKRSIIIYFIWVPIKSPNILDDQHI